MLAESIAQLGATTFSDAVGAELITAVVRPTRELKERHDSLVFLNHTSLRHEVRVVVSLTPSYEVFADGHAAGHRSDMIMTSSGRILVPIATLDRHSRSVPVVRNEYGEEVPILASYEIDDLFGGGLVAYAAKILGPTGLEVGLESCLRDAALLTVARSLSSGDPPDRSVFETGMTAIQEAILEHGDAGLRLLATKEFLQALAVVAGAVPLVVALDPRRGGRRILTFAFHRPLVLGRSRSARQPAVAAKPDQGSASDTSTAGNALIATSRSVPGFTHAITTSTPFRFLQRYWRRGGTIELTIPLGMVAGCDRYMLSAEAPFDTWFADGRIDIAGQVGKRSDPVDTSGLYRLNYLSSRSSAGAGILRLDLRAVYTGVARISVIGSSLLAVGCLLGTLRVVLARHHVFLPANADSATSVLLLFPGVAAALLATPGAHTLTATLQFPMRFMLWSLSLVSFVLALSAGMRVSSWRDIALWSGASVLTSIVAVVLRWRGAALRPRRPRPSPSRDRWRRLVNLRPSGG
jgi:hypothetical protein